jgi:hypothetical protein
LRLHELALVGVLLMAVSCGTARLRTDSAPPSAAAPPVKPSQPEPGEPRGDLEPVDGFLDLEGYHQLVQEMLLGATGGDYWMVCRPSFGPEYAVLLDCSQPEAGANASLNEASTWFIEIAKADRHIGVEGHRAVVTHRRLAIEPATGEALAEAWLAVVRRTRYAKPQYFTSDNGERVEPIHITTDGESYEFKAGRFRGRTHSPRPGLAADLAMLGDMLERCVSAPQPELPAALAECVELAKKLKESAEREPW